MIVDTSALASGRDGRVGPVSEATRYDTNSDDYLGRLDAALARDRFSGRQSKALFTEFLAAADAPAPDARYWPWFAQPDVLVQLAGAFRQGRQSERVRQAHRASLRGRPRVSVRRLSPMGSYPNLELRSGRAAYIIRNGTPYLVSINSPREGDDWGGHSEMSDWTRHETRLATALSCTEWGRFTIYLSEMRRDFPLACLDHVAKSERVTFAVEIASLLEGAAYDNAGPPYFRPQETRAPNRFADFRPFQARARTLASRFLVSHLLLLRTASHYLKATMLWATEGLTEDALARLLFALEGCLLLMQEVYGGRDDRLDRKFLRDVFAHTYVQGETLYEFIEEATGWGGTRARIVHPQLAITEGWTPFLTADDYFEYARVVRALLLYVITGTTFDDYELNEH